MTREPTPTAIEAHPMLAAVLAITTALSLVAPSGVAFHLSVGVEDTALIGAAEPPADTDEDLWERGTRTDCPDAPGPGDRSTPTSDAFCGALVYNEESSSFNTTSPRDQTSNFGVEIDLQMTTYVGAYGTTTCSPWCNSQGTYETIHDAGHEAGVLEKDGSDAWEDDRGTQAYGGGVYTVSPMQAYAAAGQPWLLPVTDTSFVAFLTEAGSGEAIDEDQLVDLVAMHKGDGLLESAQASVCAFTPQANLGTHAASEGGCEVELAWMGQSQDSENDPCQADTYVCGSLQPAWRGTTMCPMWHAACYLSDAWNSAHHFAIWHGVAAPSRPSGCPAAEPGFDTDPMAFLAHDLDIYTPPSDATPAQGLPHYWDAAAENVPGLGPLREGRTPNVADTPSGQALQDSRLFTQHETEPNTNETWLEIEESSQSLQQERTLTECQRLASQEETADPWVNIVDAHLTRDLVGLGTPAGSQPEPDHDPHPVMRITGHVGLFTDVDDDGDYEQAPGSQVLDSVYEHGAYPVLWDHHDPGEGCELRSGSSIGDLTTEAGYTSPTGLVSVLHLSDGVLVQERTGETRPIAGPTALALVSGSLDVQDPIVQDVIEQASGDRSLLVLEDAFQPQCGEPTGGFTSNWHIVGEPMVDDGLATAAILTLKDSGPGGEDTAVPASPIELASGTHVWWDVDPFEGQLAG